MTDEPLFCAAPTYATPVVCATCGSHVAPEDAHKDEPRPSLYQCHFCFGTCIGATDNLRTPAQEELLVALAQSMNVMLRVVRDLPVRKYGP